MADIHENKTDSVEKKPDKSSERLAKDCPEATASAHREALKASPHKRFTVSPEGSTGESFGLTEKGKLVASKHNSETAFYERSDSHDRKRACPERS